jgi:hypothetical protein
MDSRGDDRVDCSPQKSLLKVNVPALSPQKTRRQGRGTPGSGIPGKGRPAPHGWILVGTTELIAVHQSRCSTKVKVPALSPQKTRRQGRGTPRVKFSGKSRPGPCGWILVGTTELIAVHKSRYSTKVKVPALSPQKTRRQGRGTLGSGIPGKGGPALIRVHNYPTQAKSGLEWATRPSRIDFPDL